jgi:hypothetical protein
MTDTAVRFRPMYLDIPHELIIGIAAAIKKQPEYLTTKDVREYIAASLAKSGK